MKNLVLALFLLVSAFGFAQSEKDALLKLDSLQLDKQFRLMGYLHEVAMKSLDMTYMQKLKSDRVFAAFFTDDIVKNNPTDLTITDYLGNKAPVSWDEFSEAVFAKNFETLMATIHKYGYPSGKRFKIMQADDHSECAVIFALETTREQRKAFQKLVKKEYKLGNMNKNEYEMTKFIASPDGLDVAKVEKEGEMGNGKITMKFPNKK